MAARSGGAASATQPGPSFASPNHLSSPNTSRAEDGDDEEVGEESDSETEIESSEYEKRRDRILRKIILCEAQIQRIKVTAKASKTRILQTKRAHLLEGNEREFVEKCDLLDVEFQAKIKHSEFHCSMALDAFARKLGGEVEIAERNLRDRERIMKVQLLEDLYQRRQALQQRIRAWQLCRRRKQMAGLPVDEEEEEEEREVETAEEVRERVSAAMEEIRKDVFRKRDEDPAVPIDMNAYPEWMYEDVRAKKRESTESSDGSEYGEEKKRKRVRKKKMPRIRLRATDEEIMHDLFMVKLNAMKTRLPTEEERRMNGSGEGKGETWQARRRKVEAVEDKKEKGDKQVPRSCVESMASSSACLSSSSPLQDGLLPTAETPSKRRTRSATVAEAAQMEMPIQAPPKLSNGHGPNSAVGNGSPASFSQRRRSPRSALSAAL